MGADAPTAEQENYGAPIDAIVHCYFVDLGKVEVAAAVGSQDRCTYDLAGM